MWGWVFWDCRKAPQGRLYKILRIRSCIFWISDKCKCRTQNQTLCTEIRAKSSIIGESPITRVPKPIKLINRPNSPQPQHNPQHSNHPHHLQPHPSPTKTPATLLPRLELPNFRTVLQPILQALGHFDHSPAPLQPPRRSLWIFGISFGDSFESTLLKTYWAISQTR